MQAYVIVATRGRASETLALVDTLSNQTRPPNKVLIVATESSDVEGISGHPFVQSGVCEIVISPKAGLTAQRNEGVRYLRSRGTLGQGGRRSFCVFFDDDYRPAPDWLERAAERFARQDIVGLTGRVLADGINFGGFSEAKSEDFLSGQCEPLPHWTNQEGEWETDSVYGCNMAFVDEVVEKISFDENLPLYGWQEDRDYTGLARQYGRVIFFSECRGVHLGTRRGRTSGKRFGYSQIANPLYLMRKGTMGARPGMRFMSRALAANLARSIHRHPSVDYRGRLQGNLLALADLLLFRSDPRRILDLQ